MSVSKQRSSLPSENLRRARRQNLAQNQSTWVGWLKMSVSKQRSSLPCEISVELVAKPRSERINLGRVVGGKAIDHAAPFDVDSEPHRIVTTTVGKSVAVPTRATLVVTTKERRLRFARTSDVQVVGDGLTFSRASIDARVSANNIVRIELESSERAVGRSMRAEQSEASVLPCGSWLWSQRLPSVPEWSFLPLATVCPKNNNREIDRREFRAQYQDSAQALASDLGAEI